MKEEKLFSNDNYYEIHKYYRVYHDGNLPHRIHQNHVHLHVVTPVFGVYFELALMVLMDLGNIRNSGLIDHHIVPINKKIFFTS